MPIDEMANRMECSMLGRRKAVDIVVKDNEKTAEAPGARAETDETPSATGAPSPGPRAGGPDEAVNLLTVPGTGGS